jgi:hypothetical protein
MEVSQMTAYLELAATATVRATGERIAFNAFRWCEEHATLEVRVVSRPRVAWIATRDIVRKAR